MSWWDFGLSEETARAEELKKKDLELTLRRKERGLYASDGAFVNDYERRAAEPLFGYRSDDQGKNQAVNSAYAEVGAAAVEGAKEGLSNVVDGTANVISSTLNGTGGFIFKSIPWWVWVGAGLYGLIQLGALNRIRKAFA
jgi:hypothetical protein